MNNTNRTLRLYGPGDCDQLDPVVASGTLTRLYSRRLFTHQAVEDLRTWQAVAPVADLAAQIPSIYNAGVGASYTSYVVHLRPGVLWDTTPPRELTADDVVRGFKRMGNPVCAPPVLGYFTSTIRGMSEYCSGYAEAVSSTCPDPAVLAAYQNSHDIPGLLRLDDHTLVIELRRPAMDIIDILALPCAAPAPVEYDEFVPGTARAEQIRSTGPYRPAAQVPGQRLLLEPNPVWRQDLDPVRHRPADAIEIVTAAATPDQVMARIRAGATDLPWGQPVAQPPAAPAGTWALDPYLVLNTRSANAGGALGDVRVRQAISYAINKAAIAAIAEDLGTGAAVRIAGSVIPPGNEGHQDLAPYATAGGRGDPDRCRALLADAGRPDGFTLTAIHPSTELGAAITASCATDLAKAGITARLVALDPPVYQDWLTDPGTPTWDIAVASWWPGWSHGNGRVFLQPLFQASELRGTGNYGRYREPEADALIERALVDAVEHPARTTEAWQEAERRVLADAPVVPLLFQAPSLPPVHGTRVSDARVLPAHGYSFDLTGIRLDPAG
jgi:peptide/nickel transport system substrate-binding protein